MIYHTSVSIFNRQGLENEISNKNPKIEILKYVSVGEKGNLYDLLWGKTGFKYYNNVFNCYNTKILIKIIVTALYYLEHPARVSTRVSTKKEQSQLITHKPLIKQSLLGLLKIINLIEGDSKFKNTNKYKWDINVHLYFGHILYENWQTDF